MPTALPVQIDGIACKACGKLETLRLFLQITQLYSVEGVEEKDRPPICVGTTLKDSSGNLFPAKWLPISGRCQDEDCLVLHKGAIRLDNGQVMGLLDSCLVCYQVGEQETTMERIKRLAAKAIEPQ
jgi:hypothetical protein